jgi:tetratricopeptide (TPR) repeat protein
MAASWMADVRGDVAKSIALLETHLADRKVAMQWGSVQFKNKKEPVSWLPLLKQQFTRNEWAELAATADKEEFWAAARFCYEQALKLDPNDAVLLNNWAWAAMNTKEFDKEKVLDACRRAYAAFPRSLPVLDTFAEALLRVGRFEECINLLNANLAVTRRTPQLLWVLAKAYESNNDFENALRTYRQVIDLQSRIKDWEVRVGKDTVTEQIRNLQLKAN